MKWRGAAIGGGATSGKLGPAVASRNKGGQYLRSRVVPSGATPTPPQEVLRNAIRSLSPTWANSLGQSDRDAWNTYARNVTVTDVLGDSIQLSGQNWYLGANTLRVQAGLPIVEPGPTEFNRGGVALGARIEVGTTTGTLSLTASPFDLALSADDGILVFAGHDFSPGRSKYFGGFQLATVVEGDATASDFAFTLPFAHTGSNSISFNIVLSRADGRYTTPSRITVTP